MSGREEGYGPPEPYGPAPEPGGSYQAAPCGYPPQALPGNPGTEFAAYTSDAQHPGDPYPAYTGPGPEAQYYPQHPVNYGPRFYPVVGPPGQGPQAGYPPGLEGPHRRAPEPHHLHRAPRPPTTGHYPRFPGEAGQVAAPVMAGPMVQGPAMARPPMAGPMIQGPRMAGPHMAGMPMAGPMMAGPTMSGPPMARPMMTGPPMSNPPMAGPMMAGPPMSGPPMSGPPMSGPMMAGPMMTGPPMSGPPMSGPIIAGPHTMMAQNMIPVSVGASPMMPYHPGMPPQHQLHPQMRPQGLPQHPMQLQHIPQQMPQQQMPTHLVPPHSQQMVIQHLPQQHFTQQHNLPSQTVQQMHQQQTQEQQHTEQQNPQLQHHSSLQNMHQQSIHQQMPPQMMQSQQTAHHLPQQTNLQQLPPQQNQEIPSQQQHMVHHSMVSDQMFPPHLAFHPLPPQHPSPSASPQPPRVPQLAGPQYLHPPGMVPAQHQLLLPPLPAGPQQQPVPEPNNYPVPTLPPGAQPGPFQEGSHAPPAGPPSGPLEQGAPAPAPAAPEQRVAVPWGWKRLLLAESIVYFSPSGIQLKSADEVQEYLSTEGTCKCGLQCPLAVQASFDFRPGAASEVQVPAPGGAAGQCKHHGSAMALAQMQANTGFAIRHYHNPTFNRTKDGIKRKVKKKKKPFSGVLVSQMLAAREAEKLRINEIIAQQKALEAQKTYAGDVAESMRVTAGPPPQPATPEPAPGPGPREGPSTPPAHLTPRMVHPAMLGRGGVLSLGEVLPQAPASPAASPGPQPQEPPRGVSLAEAMQAARRLNLQQEQEAEQGSGQEEEEEEDEEEEEEDTAVSDPDCGRLMILESEPEERSSESSPALAGSPEKEKGWDDLAKNIEIRRLSNTDDGNKVLESTFHSPNKDLKKNPLMNIFDIVSGMDAAPPPPEEAAPRGQAGPAALGIRPQLRGRKSRQYSTLPPLPHSPPPWVLGGPNGGPRPQLPAPGAPQQIMLAPQMVVQGPPAPQQFMQLLQTVNGPMLVPVAAPQQQMVQLQAPGPRPRPRKPEPLPGPAPLLMAQAGGMVSFQGQGPPVSAAQMMVTQAGPGPQLVVGGQGVQGMQGMILMPQPQGIMYQQLPDGSLVQVQGQVQGLLPQGQLLVPGPAPQLVVAPAPRQLLPGLPGVAARKRPNVKKMRPKKKTKLVEEGAEQEQDETDTSFEEPQASTSTGLSPRSSIQSNKVDSSGLHATPPHQKDTGDFEQMRGKSPVSETEFRDLLDTTEEGEEREEDRAGTSASNLSFVEEKILISDEEDSGGEEEAAHNAKFVTSSSKKRKKRKKRGGRDSERSAGPVGQERGSPPESPVVPPEPRDFRVGDLVWGPAHGFPSWPGKLVRGGERTEGSVWVCWFGTRHLSQVEGHRLKTLSEGLEAHHRERKKSRRGRKMNTSLEKAIQEAMAELD